MKMGVRIATRKSSLALWQANFVKNQLEKQYPDLEVELLGIHTAADKMLATPLNKIGGKGLFVKELEKAILERQADIAVHSIKDMPASLPKDLTLSVILKREDPRDAFISNHYASIYDMPPKSILGTSSLRRSAQALALRPDLVIKSLRGNVGTRLKKLDAGEFDGIILAAAGLKRLNQASRIRAYFTTEEILPAAGQGAIGIECRLHDDRLNRLLAFMDDSCTRYAVLAERVLTQELGGSCLFPIASYGIVKNNTLYLHALVSDTCGQHILKSCLSGPKEEAEAIGLKVAQDLIAQGAKELLLSVQTEQLSE